MARINSCIGVVFLVLLGFTATAQDRYAVYFKYKPQTEFSLLNPQEFLTQKALDRRTREGVRTDSLDLPVAAKYLDQLALLSDYLLYSSKWMNAAVLVTDKSRADQIGTFPFVEKVELVAKNFLANPTASTGERSRASALNENNTNLPKLNNRELTVAENSYDFQNKLIGIDVMHAEGFTGEGVTIAVFDAGFPGTDTVSAFVHLFTNSQIVAQRDFVRPWNRDVFSGHQHGTNVLSLIAANEPAKLVSGAYGSDFILVITEEVETEYRVEEFNWVRAAEFADSLGADIISSSLGYWDFDDPAMNYTVEDLDGKTTTITQGVTIASEKGILIVNSVGNYGSAGESSLLAPADGAGIISVGSVNANGEVSSFSSRGPTGDGRVKPELAAFGDSPVLIRANGTVGSSNGTSFSAPQIAALAAGLWEAKPELTKAELMENLFRSASQYGNPDNLLGYGVPNFYNALYGEILSVEDQETIAWKVFPNPLVADEVTIYFGTGTTCSFELIDMTGRPLIQSELSRYDSQSPYQVQMSGIKPGFYLILLREGSYLKQTKLMRR
ncbi:S8 family serine peptidase [Algoriphagus jejuensis]|uniref:S8 family serine peptidase n=1 Tax=Algoriphagus jejuensis TaxID=419934 RepID=A0ABP3Y6P7_9BACT